MSGRQLDGGGGSAGGSGGSSLSDYLSPGADSLWGRVQFGELVGDFFRAYWKLLSMVGAGLVLGTKEGASVVISSLWTAGDDVYTSLRSGITGLGDAATAAASEQARDLGLASGTITVMTILLSLLFIVVLITIFVYEGDR